MIGITINFIFTTLSDFREGQNFCLVLGRLFPLLCGLVKRQNLFDDKFFSPRKSTLGWLFFPGLDYLLKIIIIIIQFFPLLSPFTILHRVFAQDRGR